MRFMKRLISALVIFVPFGLYVYLIQIAYDATKGDSEPKAKAALFLIALLAGSITYDGAKRILFLADPAFDKFFKKLVETWAALAALIISAVISAALLYKPQIFPLWLAALAYILALVCTGWVVMSASSAIELAAKK